MLTKIALSRAFAILLAVTAVAGLAYSVGYRSGWKDAVKRERLAVDWNGSASQTRDAIRRFAAKEGLNVERAMAGRFARVTFFPAKNCIQLMIEPGGVGGTPIYCYRAGTTQLVEEYSEVE